MDSFRTIHVQPCVVCGGTTQRLDIELTYEFGEIGITVRGVPADVCQSCGEQYIPGPVGVWLGRQVTRVAENLRELVNAQEGFEHLSIQADVPRHPEQLIESTAL